MKKIWIPVLSLLLASQALADLRMANYRWRLNNAAPGNENWAAGTNSAITIAPGQQIRLRVEVDNEDASNTAPYYIDLYYSTVKDTNSAVWTRVANVAGAHFNIALTDYFTESDPMNDEPNFPNENPFGGGTFIEANPNRSFDFLPQKSHELEYSIIATGNASVGTTYYFIIKPNGGVLNDWRPWDGIEEWPRLTISATATVPTVTTTAASSIGNSSATLGGNVTSAGGLSVIDRGVVYSTTDDSDPEVWESGITRDANGTGTGTFSESIGSLTSGATYYYRAYATNSVGTGYGTVQSFTPTVDVTFSDGSGFVPTVTRGGSDQVLGRFELTGAASGASLESVSIKLNGTRTGLSQLKFWASSDDTFGSDVQLGTTVSSDPGDGSAASYSGFSSAISTGGTYYFLTGDVAADATGNVRGVVVENASLTLDSGVLSGSLSNEPLSGDDISLPVSLYTFSASQQGNYVALIWSTQSETDNVGFILERAEKIDPVSTPVWMTIATYESHEALRGQGNTTSLTDYAFTDVDVTPGRGYFYRLSDVSSQGAVHSHAPLVLELNADLRETGMDKAHPNPFNPKTYISYYLSDAAETEIAVIDMLGRRVKILFEDEQSAGSHHVYWDGTDELGQQVASGVYLIRMHTREVIRIQRVLFIK